MAFDTTIPRDKLLHLLAGAIAAAAAVILWTLLGLSGHTFLVGLVAASVAGAAKETYDWVDNRYESSRGRIALHGVELEDFYATAAGGAIAAGCITMLMRVVQ